MSRLSVTAAIVPHNDTLKEIGYDETEQSHGVETRMGAADVVSLLLLFQAYL